MAILRALLGPLQRRERLEARLERVVVSLPYKERVPKRREQMSEWTKGADTITDMGMDGGMNTAMDTAMDRGLDRGL